ncbi:MAG: DUF488 domain-containing protein [Alphaproteobacteria bacterium]
MTDAPIYTIGYGGRMIGDFLALLAAFEIVLLVDVRSYPASRFQPDYGKKRLSEHLKEAGTGYRFMGDALGGKRKEAECYLDGAIDYGRVRTLPVYRAGIAELIELSRGTTRLAVMCAEKRPETCHRARLIGGTLAEMQIPFRHIDEAGAAQSHDQVMARLNDSQGDLFDG